MNRTFLRLVPLVMLLPFGLLQAQRPQDNWYLDTTWNKSAAGSGALSSPYGVAIGPDGRIYVGDQGAAKIVIYNPDGSFNGTISGPFGSSDSFSAPRGMITDKSGKLFVADAGRNAVFVFSSAGSFVRKIGGTAGSGDEQLSGVIDTGVDATGEVYVLENGNGRVSVFGADGTFLRKWAGAGALAGQLTNPLSMAVTAEGRVYICQHEWVWQVLHTVSMKEFDRNGIHVRTVSTVEGVGDFGHSYAFWRGGASVRVDAGGYPHALRSHFALYSTGAPNPDDSPVIGVYNRDLVSQFDYGPTGIGAGNFRHPCHAIGPDGTMVLCSNTAKTLYVFKLAYRELPVAARNAIPIPAVWKTVQRSNSPLVDIDYEVTDADDPTVTTGMLAFKNGSQTLADCIRVMTLAEGTGTQIGTGITANAVHRVTWNAGTDWATNLGDFRIAVLAKDSRTALLDIHYLRLPAEHSLPALKISRSPLLESDFMQLWWWLLATKDAAISLNAGKIYGVGGAADGKVLNDNGTTSADGRVYLYAKLQVREATTAEVQWAREAATAGSIEVWTPARSIGGRPRAVNEYGFDTGNWGTAAWWVVPLN